MDRFESGIGPRQKEAKPAAGLTDATDHDRRAFQRCGDGGWHGNVDPPSATVRGVGREFGGNAPPDAVFA